MWYRWDYPNQVGSSDFDERFPIFAYYLADNWPAYRTWGLSAISPWEFGHYWKPRDGVDRRRQILNVDWASLQRPGLSADYVDGRYERMDLAFERADWIPTVAAQALLRYNRPLLAYLAGKPSAFTGKDHVFTAGEVLEKQLVVINDSREEVACDARWSLGLPNLVSGSERLRVAPGKQVRIPLRFTLPSALASGDYALTATVRFADRDVQEDSLRFQVIAAPGKPSVSSRIAVFDSNGETSAQLKNLGIRSVSVGADADLSTYDVLIVGKAALQPETPAPDIARVRDGLKVLIFEQTSEVLERRFGFRVAEYGLRRVFPRVPDHPVLAGIDGEQLHDWRGEATLLPPRLASEMRPRYGSSVTWCGLPVTRLWRSGNRGNVASVLIEKPARGDFLPIVDGGYDLQYSPLLEYREGRGVIVFCQLDLTGRTETDPVAERLMTNLLHHLSEWKPVPDSAAVYAGEPAGKAHLEAAGFSLSDYRGGPIPPASVLILGPGAERAPGASRSDLRAFLQAGGRVAALGQEQVGLDALFPFAVGAKSREHIATYFEPGRAGTAFAGIGPADVHNRSPRSLPLIVSGATVVGDGVLALGGEGRVAFCQLVPWEFPSTQSTSVKRTFRRVAFAVSRLLANQGVPSRTPIVERFRTPLVAGVAEKRWLAGLYLDLPEEWDDPYRFFRW